MTRRMLRTMKRIHECLSHLHLHDHHKRGVEMQMTQSSPHIRLNYSVFFHSCMRFIAAACVESYKQFFIA